MSRRAATAVAWSGVGVFLALNAYVYWALATGRTSSDEWLSFAAGGFAVAGALIASRHPRNPVGWILLVVALVLAFGSAAEVYVTSDGLPGRAWVGWASEWTWYGWMVLVSVHLPLVFPTGRLASDRWRPVAWLGALGFVLAALGTALRPGRLDLDVELDNPVGVLVSPGVASLLDTVSNVVVGAAFLLAAASLLQRFRAATGVERAQLEWFVLVGLATVACLTLAMVNVLFPGRVTDVIGAIGWFGFLGSVLLGLPVALGIAILRHRLLDIELVVNRTLVYGPLTIGLLGVYVASVLVLQLVLRPFTGDSDLAVAVSTLATAALVRPGRAALQRVVDRRFYRRRYDAARILEEFGSRLRSELDLQAVGDDLRVVVDQTVQPSSVRLWLRGTT